jgi:hypothetical protein
MEKAVSNVVLSDILNDDVIGVIKSHLPQETVVWLSKEDYIANHSVIKRMIPQCLYDEYIHDIVSHDCSFVFQQIMHEQFDKFHNWKRFEKGGHRHHSYLTYLRDKCVDSGSVKCAAVIDGLASEKGFSANWYKRRGIIISTTSKTVEGDH